jgi:hypothetical protein
MVFENWFTSYLQTPEELLVVIYKSVLELCAIPCFNVMNFAGL